MLTIKQEGKMDGTMCFYLYIEREDAQSGREYGISGPLFYKGVYKGQGLWWVPWAIDLEKDINDLKWAVADGKPEHQYLIINGNKVYDFTMKYIGEFDGTMVVPV